jgi:hypothetical protein
MTPLAGGFVVGDATRQRDCAVDVATLAAQRFLAVHCSTAQFAPLSARTAAGADAFIVAFVRRWIDEALAGTPDGFVAIREAIQAIRRDSRSSRTRSARDNILITSRRYTLKQIKTTATGCD